MKLISLSALSLFLTVSLLVAGPHHRRDAKITKNEAEHIALKHFPGARVTAAKLETARGILVWSIVIAPGNAQRVAVAVDARTGRVVSDEKRTR